MRLGLGFLLALCFAQPAFAARVVLFDRAGIQVADYGPLAAKIEAGDTLVFSDGKEFEIAGILGHGNVTMVLGLADGRVLRVPIGRGFHRSRGYPEYISSFLLAYPELAEAGVPVVKVYEHESREGEYALVEKLEIAFTLEDLIKPQSTIMGEQRDRAVEGLIEFARKTWAFSEIGDFRAEQIAWVKDRGWVLFDFMEGARAYEQLPLETAFEQMRIPGELRNRIWEAVMEERAEHGSERCALMLTYAAGGR
jgi:hypothetical protein